MTIKSKSSSSKSSKPEVCEHCTGQDLVRRITTYPVRLTGPPFNIPELEGKQIYIGRVALYECQSCGHLMPTPAGWAKIARNVELDIRLFLGKLF